MVPLALVLSSLATLAARRAILPTRMAKATGPSNSVALP